MKPIRKTLFALPLIVSLLPAEGPFETSKNGFVFLPATGSGPAISHAPRPRGPAEFSIPQPAEADAAHIVDVSKTPALLAKISVDSTDNLRGFQEIFAYMEEKFAGVPSKLILPPGEYRVKVRSKNDFVLKNKRDFTLDGHGATLVFSYTAPENGRTVELFLFNIRSCLNTRIVDLKIDWDWENYPIASLVEVVGIGEAQESLRIRVEDFNPARKRQFESADSIYSDFQPFDAHRGAIGVKWVNQLGIGGDAVMPLRWGSAEKKFFEEKVDWEGAEATFRPLPEKRGWVRDYVRVGFTYLVRHYVYTSTAVALNANTNLTLDRVTVYSAPGMGIGGKGKGRHTWIKNFNLINKPGTYGKRWCTAAADAINFGSTLGYLKIEDSRIENNLDDGVNLHDFLHIGAQFQAGSRELILKDYQPRAPFDAGDTCELVMPDYRPLSPPFLAKVVAAVVTPRTGPVNRFSTLELDRELPRAPGVDQAKMIVINRSYDTGNYIIRNLSITGNKGRGMLLQTPNGLVEDCRVSFNRKHGLSMDIEAGTQGEGFGPTNIVVRRCVFENNNIETVWNPFRGAPVIRISAFSGPMWKAESELPWGAIRDILIVSNIIKGFPGVAMQVASCSNVTIADNLFQNIATEPKSGADFNGAIWVSSAKGLQVLGNRWNGSHNLQNRGLYYQSSQVNKEDIVYQGNSVVEGTRELEGDLLKITLRGLASNRKHQLRIGFRTGADGGIYRVEDEGRLLEVKGPVDTYSPREGKVEAIYPFVTPASTEMEMKIRFFCEGKNAKSENYFLKRADINPGRDRFSMVFEEIKP